MTRVSVTSIGDDTSVESLFISDVAVFAGFDWHFEVFLAIFARLYPFVPIFQCSFIPMS